jgi:phosphate/sulfate permease
MKRLVAVAAAVLAASVMLCQTANAGPHKRHARPTSTDPRIVGATIAVGAGAAAGYFALGGWHWNAWDLNASGLTKFGAYMGTTIGCMAVAPMVSSAVVSRPLTLREAQVVVAGCALPIVGGWLVNEAWNQHPEWDQYEAPVPQPVRLVRRRH